MDTPEITATQTERRVNRLVAALSNHDNGCREDMPPVEDVVYGSQRSITLTPTWNGDFFESFVIELHDGRLRRPIRQYLAIPATMGQDGERRARVSLKYVEEVIEGVTG